MKAMKSMSMNRVLGTLKRRPREDGLVDSELDTPEANAARNVKLFCESAGPNASGEEVLYLPAIVEAAESSPSAAKECAYSIRKFLSKDNYSKPYVQYNGIMLIRILADNPGKTFTRNIDAKFVQTVKELLRTGRDPSVKQILIETLATFQREKENDEGLVALNDMWKKEQEKMAKVAGPPGPPGPRTLNAPPFDPHSQNYFSRNHHSHKLPNPQELASRIEEARTSAKLLSQVVQSTPPSEVLSSDLIKEFADRCLSASRSVQAYMIAENPSPDNDTMETLIETNEMLSKAMSQHQRAVLQARKATGVNGDSTPPMRPASEFFAPQAKRTESGFAAPPGPPPAPSSTIPSRKAVSPPIPPPGDYAPTGTPDNEEEEEEIRNPFKDPEPASSTSTQNPPFPSDKPPLASDQFNDTLGVEPYHPGFRASQSYTARQDSSIGKATMHVAATEPADTESEDNGYEPPQPKPATTTKPVYRY